MQIAKIICNTEVEGPGKRTAIWFQGCSIRCKGCINKELQQFGEGTDMDVTEVVEQVKNAGDTAVTILGGEPLDQASSVMNLVHRLKLWIPGMHIMLFTGYEPGEAEAKLGPIIWPVIDILVTGKYEQAKPDSRKWVGSTNQKVFYKGSQKPKHGLPRMGLSWNSASMTLAHT